jgi:hypothetical protein
MPANPHFIQVNDSGHRSLLQVVLLPHRCDRIIETLESEPFVEKALESLRPELFLH